MRRAAGYHPVVGRKHVPAGPRLEAGSSTAPSKPFLMRPEPPCADPGRISFSHGAAWNALIRRYIMAISFSGDMCAARCGISAGSPPNTLVSSAMTRKVGDAANDSPSAALSGAEFRRMAPPSESQDRAWLMGSCRPAGFGTPPLRRPTPRSISRRALRPRHSCRASSTTYKAESAGSLRASLPRPPAGRAA